MKEIELTQGQVALIDDEDEALVRSYGKWTAFKPLNTFYAQTRIPGDHKKLVLMHRLIMGLTDPSIGCDHRDGNGINNQRENLRVATGSQNQGNQRPRKGASSRYKGVSWYRRYHKWEGRIEHQGHSYHLGYLDDEADAARAYDDAARELFGEFACVNFPRGDERPALPQETADG